ncbi:MAG: biopolymer transporter ExbD [Planctomycetota bacterium]
MNRHRQSGTDATISLTPMIDVVFLLVIFFMVGNRMDAGSAGVEVSLPGAGAMQAMSRLPDRKVVEVTASGDIQLDGQIVTPEQLTQTLRQQRSAYPDLRVAVRGEGDSSLQLVADVMRRISSAGVQQMDLATKSPLMSSRSGVRR